MERKDSLTNHLETCNLSTISPVKLFDRPHDNIKRVKGCSSKSSVIPELKITNLQNTVKRQETEIKRLNNEIVAKDDNFEQIKVKLEKATELLVGVSQENGNLNEIHLFLGNSCKKRSVEDEVEINSKKKKVDNTEDLKMLSFDLEESQMKRKKRKIYEDVDTQEIADMLKSPSEIELVKERELNKQDAQILADKKSMEKLELKWANDKKKMDESKELKNAEKEKALAFKVQIRNLSNQDLLKMTEANMVFLSKILSGEVKCARHNLFFHKSAHQSQTLLYNCIQEPYADEQVNFVYSLVLEKFRSVPKIEENYIREHLYSVNLLNWFMFSLLKGGTIIILISNYLCELLAKLYKEYKCFF